MKQGFPGGSDCKESACNAGDRGSIPGLGRTLEKGMANRNRLVAGIHSASIQGRELLTGLAWAQCPPPGLGEEDLLD